MNSLFILTLCAGVFLASALGTRLLLGYLRKRQILDIPNQRSNHTMPTPRGAGLAVTASLWAGWCIWYVSHYEALYYLPFFIAATWLAVFSFLDDLKPLPVGIRLLTQAIMVTASLYLLKMGGLVFQGIFPPYLDRIVTGILWLWFINLYNFMDGIDGITSIETISLGLGIALIAVYTTTKMENIPLGLMLAAAAAGFLIWNWHPAKIFLGDSGSISLGYILGFLLINLALAGYWEAALILPGYYLLDSGFTLIKRIIRREKFWQAHSGHFYQQAVRNGKSPRTVVYMLAGLNAALIALALANVEGMPAWLALPLAFGMVLAVMMVLGWKRGGAAAIANDRLGAKQSS